MGSNAAQYTANAAGQAQTSANQIAKELSPYVSALTSGINMGGVNSNVFSYLMNPNNTNLSQQYGDLSNFYNQEMTQGLSPATINAAINSQEVASQQELNSYMNQAGATTPNPAGTLRDMQFQNTMGLASLNSQLAAQNQGVQQQGAQNEQNLASSLDSQTLQMYMDALSGGQSAYNSAINPLENMFGSYENAATNLTGEAGQLYASEPNIFSSILGGLEGAGSIYGDIATGGALGGLSSLLGGSLFGGLAGSPFTGVSPYFDVDTAP